MNTYPQPNTPTVNPPARRSNNTTWLILGGGVVIGTFLVLGIVVAGIILYLSQDNIAQDVTVAGLPVSGMSSNEARNYLAQNVPAQSLLLTDGTRNWSLRLVDLGININVDATLNAAQNANAGENVQPFYTVDLNQSQSGFIYLSDLANIPASTNPAQNGRAIDIPVMLERLRVNLNAEIADGVLDLSMIDVAPPVQENAQANSGATTVHVVERGQELGLIAKEYGVSVEDILAVNDLANPDVIYVGQELIIPAGGVYEPAAADAPPAPTGVGKEIVVSVDNQRIYAYENGQLVRSHLVSTGLPDTPTVYGDYHIYIKLAADDMAGPGYYLPQVPYTMYFYQGYAIHGTYWHNAFGRPMSHGCVNLPTSEAEWFFNWAEVGTLVRVI
ncbi:MAG: L,D-transpeptidase family protein [Chloroflexi bacterium]|nr:L,D-transpeptidase family protein [Chloroflexota bacterium]